MNHHDLADLGWSAFEMSQLTLGELDLDRFRISEVHRSRLVGLGPSGPRDLTTSDPTGTFTTGDWVLAEASQIVRLLDRKTVVARRAAGERADTQLIAANIDTLFIVTSCNADFNLRRLERYLALAYEAGILPVILLTKSDLDDPEGYVDTARDLKPGLEVIALDARAPEVATHLAPWCRKGQTVALVGSSGVGKTTLTNALTGGEDLTAGIREDDAKGRHTTTHRALRPMPQGGWIIDTPGMRELRLADVAEGIDAVFDDLAELARQCRFSDCSHQTEPGCAIRHAIDTGQLDPARLARWDKLKREDRFNSESLHERAERSRKFGRDVKRMLKEKSRFTGKR